MDISFVLTLFLVFLVSLCFGSFVSVVSYRIPRNLDFIGGRSFCDRCKTKLSWYDNIPLFTFLFYKGKGRCCGQEISIRYPIIELITAVGIMYLYLASSLPVSYLLFLITFTILIIDFEHQIIPDNLTWLILLISFLTNLIFLPNNILFGLLASLFLLLIHLVTLGRGMGLGDVKLAIALGSFLDLFGVLNWLLVSFVSGGIIAFLLLLFRKSKLKTKIAFGPFLVFGFWICYIINYRFI